jgi:branched-subunit amino acid aminotransferase/4-amino-4-deoxychorismate lyase
MSTAYFYGGEWHNPAKSSPSMDFRSRIHRYGDGFFESAIYFNGAIRHVHHHVERIKQSLTLLKMPTLPVSIDEIMQLITEKINDEKWSSARIRLSFFREERASTHLNMRVPNISLNYNKLKHKDTN